MIIGLDDRAVGSAEAVELQHTEEQHTLFAKIPLSVPLASGQSIGFKCIDGRYRLFEIIRREMVEPDGVWEVQAIDKAVRELMDEPVEEQRARSLDIGTYAGRLIQNTRFSLGTVSSYATGTITAYYQSVWSALEQAAEAYDVNIIPYYTFSNGLVSGRYIDITETLGQDRGRIFEFGDDMSGIRVSYDDSGVVTALYGRGRGLEIESGGDDEASYGRRLTFADVVWSTSDGDPVDKPDEQEWVGDPAALAAFGRNGRHRFGFAIFEECTDPDELLQLTWDQLQKQKEPAISITADVVDTERMMGRTHEAVRLGDPVLVRIPKRGIDIHANVTSIVRDYIKPEATRLTISNPTAESFGTSAGKIIKQVQETVSGVSAKSDVWDRAGAAFDVDGVMDVMHNQIISTTGNWYTDPDTGSIMMVSSDGTKAMMLNGSGWMIADSKTGDAWDWKTAATGGGIVANQITTGTLNANNVTIGGSGTTLTGTSLQIVHSNISNSYKTIVDSNGMRIMEGNTVLGGLVNLGGSYTMAAEAIYNPAGPLFRSDVAAYTGMGESMLGLSMRYGGTIGGIIGAYSNDGETCSGLGIRNSTSNVMYIDAQNSDVVFLFRYNGVVESISIGYIWKWIYDHDD